MRYILLLLCVYILVGACKKSENPCTNCVTLSGNVIDSFSNTAVHATLEIKTYPEDLVTPYYNLNRTVSCDEDGHFQVQYDNEDAVYWSRYLIKHGGCFRAYVIATNYYDRYRTETIIQPSIPNIIRLLHYGRLVIRFQNETRKYSSHHLNLTIHHYDLTSSGQRMRYTLYGKDFYGDDPKKDVVIPYWSFSSEHNPYECELVSLTNGDILWRQDLNFERGEYKDIKVTY